MAKPNFKLKELRQFYNLSQKQISGLMDIAVTTYNRKENGLVEFTELEIVYITNIFNEKAGGDIYTPMDIFFKKELPNR